MISPSLAHTVGRSTATLYLLDRFGVLPVEPIMTDLVPGVTPWRGTLDHLSQDTVTASYEVTRHALWPLDIASNIRRAPRIATVTGIITNAPLVPANPFGAPTPTLPAPPMPQAVRGDVARADMLQQLADARRLVMLVTPTYVLTPAVVTSISRSWTPDDGYSVQVAITVEEVRVVSPMFGELTGTDGADLDCGAAGTSGGGAQSPAASTLDVTTSTTPGNAPAVGAA